MEFRILGPLEVLEGGRPLPLGAAKQRALLAVLLLHANEVVSTDRLIDALWGERAPDTAAHTLQVYVSQLRKSLRADGTAPAEPALLTRPPGYLLRVRDGELDVDVFRARVQEGRNALADGDPARATRLLGDGLGLWRGSPLSEFAYEEFAQRAIATLEDLRLSATEDNYDAQLALARHAEAVGELQAFVAEHPLRERPRAQLMLALYRSGRQAEALAAYQDARRALTEELGIDPSPGLQQLERAVLAQDAELDWHEPPAPIRAGEATHADAAGAASAIQTFLVADIRGYAAFTEEHGDEAGARLVVRFAELAGKGVDARAGRVVELRGDEAVAVFGSARQAILTAIELQALFVQETALEPALPLPVGIGIDAGEAVPLQGGYRGGAVNIASRISALAGPGEILATREVVHLAGRTDGVTSVDRGATRVSGLAEPLELVRLKPEGWDPRDDVAFRRALGPAATQLVSPGFEVPNPYRGLRPFEEADAAHFFGREALTAELVARFATTNFLAVVGPSGSGKSSVVRAGLIPAIRRGALPGSERWLVVEMLPGAHVLEELEASLLRIAVNPPPSLLEQLERDEHGLLRAVKRVLPADDQVLVLVIDQLEEVFTLGQDEGRRAHFLAGVAAAVSEPRSPLRVVTTLRADFYDRPLLYRGFADLMRSYVEAVVPLSPGELERAIANPAKQVDVDLEPGLLAAMLADVVDEPGALPLLQFALTELFERREEGRLTLSAYRSIGGVAGALAGRADELYESLDADAREACRQLFLRLVTLGEGTDDARRRASRAELGSMEVDQRALTRVLDAFGASRLVSFDRDLMTGQPTVEVAHEALLKAWGLLRGWIEGARQDVRMHRRLAASTTEWADADRDPSFLLRGTQLAQFEPWIAASRIALTGFEREYVDLSVREREKQETAERARRAREAALERRSVLRLRSLVAVLTVAVLVASGLTLVATSQRHKAQAQARIATARQLAADARANLGTDPERSILLALAAVDATRSAEGTVLREAKEALHQAVEADRVVLRLDVHPVELVYSHDGSRLATAGTNANTIFGQPVLEPQEKQATVWDAATGKRLLTLKHRSRVWDVEFSPDGSRLATSTEDGTVAIWDAQTGERLLTRRAGEGPSAVQVDFSPDGRRLVATDGSTNSGEGPGTIWLWSVRTGDLDGRWSTPGRICGIAFSPDGQLVAGGLCGPPGGKIFVWDARTGERIRTLEAHTDLIYDLAWSPDGSRIAIASADGTAKVLDVRSGGEILTLTGSSISLSGVAFAPDGRLVATVGWDGTVKLWNAESGAQVLVLSGNGGGNPDVAFSPDGERVASGGLEGTLVWDITPSGSREQLTLKSPGATYGLAYSPDGSGLVVPNTTGRATLWDSSSGRKLRTFSGEDASWNAAFGPHGALLVTTPNFVTGSPVVWDTASGRVLHVLDTHGSIGGVAVSPDGSLIATGSCASGVTVWDATSGARVRVLHTPSQALDFSPDGSLLAAGGCGGAVTFWKVPSFEMLRRIPGHGSTIFIVDFSPDGSRLAASSFDGKPRVWDVAKGDQVLSLVGHKGPVTGLAFSPDGKLLATSGGDNTARLWDASTGREVLTLTGATTGMTDLAFSPDGTRLAVSETDGTVRIYVLPIDQLIKIARARLTRSWTIAECRQYLHVATCPAPA